MPPDPFSKYIALTPDQMRQKIERLEARVTALERKQSRPHYMDDFFASINGSELYYVLSKRLEECGYSLADVHVIQFQTDGAGYVILADEKRVNFIM